MAEVPAQPENQGAWASATKGLLGNAKSVTDELFAALKDKDISYHTHLHGKSVAPYVNPGPKCKADLDAKLAVTRFAVNTVDAAIQRASQCVIRIGHEQQKKWAPLKVCEWRMALRARRPPRELFKDHVCEALEKEQQSLLEARVKLVEVINEGKAIIEECEANKLRLVRNVQAMVMLGHTKLPAMNADGQLQWFGSSPSSPASPQADASPAEPASPPAAEGEDGSPAQKKKPVIPTEPAALLLRAPQLEEMVWKYIKKGDNAVQIQRVKCEKAHEAIMQCFQKRWAENEVLKKSLEQQIHQMAEAIETAETSCARMKKRIDFFAEVELQPKYDGTQAILVKMRASKAQLEDDFHHKLVSMKIDESCRKITPERATGVAPESIPIDAMLQGPAHRKKMNRNNSSPAVGNTSTERPPSPAGISSPLKAAATASMA